MRLLFAAAGIVVLMSLVSIKGKPKQIAVSDLPTVRPGQYEVTGKIESFSKRRDIQCIAVKDNSGLSPELCTNKNINLIETGTSAYRIEKNGDYYTLMSQTLVNEPVLELYTCTGRYQSVNGNPQVEIIRDGRLEWIEVAGSLAGFQAGSKVIVKSNGITEIYTP